MCPAAEIHSRTFEEVLAQSHFELNQSRDGFEKLAVKKFFRPAAGAITNEPDAVRTPIVLYHVVSYLRDCIADQDRIAPGKSYYSYAREGPKMQHSYSKVYTFMNDRFR